MALPRNPSRRLLPILLLLAALGAQDSRAIAADPQARVLVLYSLRHDAEIVTIGESELPRLLSTSLGRGFDYYSEYIDIARFPDQAYREALRDFLREKYRSRQPDIVITIQDQALEFAEQHRDELFGGAPIVFFATDRKTTRPPNSTGLVVPVNLADTLAFITTLQPDVRHVFVVSGATESDQAFERLARTQFGAIDSRLELTSLSGLATTDLTSRLAALPPHSAVYYLVVDRDGAGHQFHPLDYLDTVTAHAAAPTYCWVDSAMGHGIVGGSLKDQTLEIVSIGRLAVRVLRGESADSIPVGAPDLNIRQVDWRQLQRWRLAANVPHGTLVRFVQPSLWEQYRVYLLGAALLLLAQSALIVGLLVQRARRRHAEERVVEGQSALQASYERIRDLGTRLLNAQEAERSRLARELHDDIGQELALLSLDVELLGRPAPAEHLAREALARTQAIARSVQALSRRLHPARLRLIGLTAALEGLQQELARSDIAVTVTHRNVPASMRADLTVCFFRVAQEAVHNAIKHSGARNISVHLEGRQGTLTLHIADDGAGFDVQEAWGRGLGLVSMDERLAAVGGSVTISSASGAGTTIDVHAPLPSGGEPDMVSA